MSDFWIAVAGGATGTVITALFAFGGRLTRIRSEIEANDRALRILDRHLETWASDASIDLIRELETIRADLSARGLMFSGAYSAAINRAKEEALQRYRDQERTAQSQADEIRAGEGALHGVVRAWRLPTLDLELRTPQRVIPILDRWAIPPTRHLPASDESQPIESDPRSRTIESTMAYLDDHADTLK